MSKLLAQIAVLFILPGLIVDYCNSSANEAKFYAKIAVTTIFQIAGLFMATIGEVRSNSDKKRKIGKILFAIVTAVGAVFYRWSLELAFYIALIAGCLFYAEMWKQVHRQKTTRVLIALILSCFLVLLMNDWKLTVDAVKSGEILATFWFNTCLHLQLGVIMALHNMLATYFRSDIFTWAQVKMNAWDYWSIYCFLMLPLVFITLYAPTTTNKLFG